MASQNKKKTSGLLTHEGAPAKAITSMEELRRSTLACMLWEDEFYEDGESIVDRIRKLVAEITDNDAVASLALEARARMKLRHAPLLLVRELARKGYPVAKLLTEVIARPDELTEFLAIYWKDGREPLSAQVKKGLAEAFTTFDSYQLAKYNRDGIVKLRDVLFLVHGKPKDEAQAEVWKKLVDGTLESPDTWEVNLSQGGDKRETFTRLLSERKLGALAFLRNLRNMIGSGVDRELIAEGIRTMNVERLLPFRFIAAARYAPALESALEEAMLRSLSAHKALPGFTAILVDVSGSMDAKLSARSEMTRLEAACALAILLREIGDVRVFTFSSSFREVPARRGFALRDAIAGSQPHASTQLGQAVKELDRSVRYDRLIVVTDEQSHDKVPAPTGRGYMINVASAKNGVGYGDWIHIDGWSEAVVEYIREKELGEPA